MLYLDTYTDYIKQTAEFVVSPFEFTVNSDNNYPGNVKSDHHLFISAQEGSALIIVDFEEYLMNAGRVFFLKKGQVFTWRKVDNLKGIMVLYTDAVFNDVALGIPASPNSKYVNCAIAPIAIIDKKRLANWNEILGQLQIESTWKSELSIKIIGHYLNILMLFFCREVEGNSKQINLSDRKAELVNLFISLVNNHFSEYKSPKEYAEKLCITPNYLNSICNAVLDKKAGEIIQDRVILEAKKMLSYTSLTVSELSYRLGFNDNSYFGRYFRKATGLPPEQFRKNYPDS